MSKGRDKFWGGCLSLLALFFLGLTDTNLPVLEFSYGDFSFNWKLPAYSGALLLTVDNFRSFEKGLADRGGWREETLQRPEIQAPFLYPFSYAPLGEWGHISGELLGLFLGVSLLPTPSRQPLFETSDNFSLFTFNWSFFICNLAFLLTVGAFLLTMGKCI